MTASFREYKECCWHIWICVRTRFFLAECVCVLPGGTPRERADELVWRDAESFGVFGRLQAKCP